MFQSAFWKWYRCSLFTSTLPKSEKWGWELYLWLWLHWGLSGRQPWESWWAHVGRYGSPWQTRILFPENMLPSNFSLSSSLFAPPSFFPPFNLTANCLTCYGGEGSTRPSHSPLRQLVPVAFHLGLHLCGVWDSPEVPVGLVSLEQLSDNGSGESMG